LKNLAEENQNHITWVFGSTHFDEKISFSVLSEFEQLRGNPDPTLNCLQFDYLNTYIINKLFDVIHHPLYFMYDVVNHAVQMNNHSDISQSEKFVAHNKDFLFCCLNRGPWEHRCALIDSFVKHDLLENNIVSWQDPDPSVWKWKYWEHTLIIYDHCYMDRYLRTDGSDADILYDSPEQSDRSLLQVITESHAAHSFYTEKTFRNIIQGNPFVLFGRPFANQILRDRFGFKLYDNLIDYSFDSELSLLKRADMLCEQLLTLQGVDLNQLYNQCKETIRYNIQRMFEIYTNKMYIPDDIIKLSNTKHVHCDSAVMLSFNSIDKSVNKTEKDILSAMEK